MVQDAGTKKDFSTRLSPETLHQLDALVRSRKYKTRTAAIEAAVDRLFRDPQAERERRQAALERVAGSLAIGITPESYRQAKLDRAEWEAERIAGRK